jgi:diguanylate cyclase (GGDEF)-like protein
LARLTARLLGVPTTLVSLVAADRLFFASAVGLREPWASRRGAPLGHSFCRHVVETNAPLVIENAPNHPLVCDSPAIDELGMVAYAGMPVRTKQGHVLGSFAAIDHRARQWSDEELETLRDLSSAVAAEVEAEANNARLVRERDDADKALRDSESRLREAIEASLDAMFILRAVRSPEGNIADLTIADCNREALLRTRARRSHIVGRSAGAVFRDARKRGLLDACARVVETGDPFTCEYRIHTDDAPFGWAWLQIVRVGDGVAVTARDITAQKASEDSLRALALIDDLTGVSNRRGFLTAAERECQRAIREHRSALLAYIDVNDFKQINDTHGHAEGDEALRAIGKVLRAVFRGADVIGRIGGDEFAVLVLPTNFQAPSDEADRRVHDLLEHIEDGIRHRIVYQLAKANSAAATGGREYEISLSVGVASVADMSGESMSASASLAALMAEADERLYEAKRARRESQRVA